MSNQDFGYGYQTPDDSGSDFQVTCFIVKQMMATLDTMKLVQVVAVHGGGGAIARAGTVDVLPLVNQIDGANPGNPTKHSTAFGIPWWRLQGGPNAIIADPVAGDIGYVQCADRDSSIVVRTQAQANPGSRRKYSIADGIYVGGVLNAVPTQYIVFTATGINIVDLNGNMIGMGSGGITLTGNVTVTGTLTVDQLEIGENGLNVTGDVHATGTMVAGFGGADQVGLQTHTHTQGIDSHGDTEAPTAAPTAGT